MSAPPWMPLYIADYLTATRHLSARQHGGYLLLIMAAWQADGKLPASNAQALSRLAGMSVAEWDEDGPVIAAFFDADWRHARVDAELVKAKEKYRKRSEAGRRGGKAKAEPQAQPKQSPSNADGIASSNVQASGSSNAQASSSHSQSTPSGVLAPPEDVSRETEKVPTRLAEDYEPDLGAALSHGIPLDAAILEAKKFNNHYRAAPDDAGLKLDWDATWDNWCIRAAEFRLKDGKPAAKQGKPKPTRWVCEDDPDWKAEVEGWKADYDGKAPPRIAGLGGLGWHFPIREAVAA